MNATDFVLSPVDAFDGHVEGRGLMQKRVYFASLLTGIDSDFGFVTHYYGPYASTADNSVTRPKSVGFLSESRIEPPVTSSGFDVKWHDYRLTDEGVKASAAFKQNPEYAGIAAGCKAIRKAGNPDRLTLSIATKAHFIQRFNSKVNQASLRNAVQFPEGLSLVQQ